MACLFLSKTRCFLWFAVHSEGPGPPPGPGPSGRSPYGPGPYVFGAYTCIKKRIKTHIK